MTQTGTMTKLQNHENMNIKQNPKPTLHQFKYAYPCITTSVGLISKKYNLVLLTLFKNF